MEHKSNKYIECLGSTPIVVKFYEAFIFFIFKLLLDNIIEFKINYKLVYV